LRRDVQQLQLCLECFAAFEHDASHHGFEIEDPSRELIDWNSTPTNDEDFVEGYFSDPSQGLVDWSSSPTFDKDLVESYLPNDQKEELVADSFTLIFYGIHPQYEKLFEVNLSDSFTIAFLYLMCMIKTLMVKCFILMFKECLIILISLG
jgi:hypothetical protein